MIGDDSMFELIIDNQKKLSGINLSFNIFLEMSEIRDEVDIRIERLGICDIFNMK